MDKLEEESVYKARKKGSKVAQCCSVDGQATTQQSILRSIRKIQSLHVQDTFNCYVPLYLIDTCLHNLLSHLQATLVSTTLT